MKFFAILVLASAGTEPAKAPPAPTKEAIRTEIERLSHSSEEERSEALARLREFGPAAADAVVKILPKCETRMRRDLAAVLRQYAEPKTVAPIAKILSSERALIVRRSLARALGAIKTKESVEALRQHLEEEEEVAVQRDCILALADTGDPRAFEPILHFGESTENAYLREKAVGALQELTRRKAGSSIEEWRVWWNHHGPEILQSAQKREEEKAVQDEEEDD